MKKYGILLSGEEHKQLKTVAAQRGVLMQDIARDAVLAAIGQSSRPDLHAPAPTADAAKIRRAAATARQLADQLESIISDAPPTEPMLTISYSTLISMIQEMTKDGSNTSDAEAVAQRVRARLGKDRGATADTTSSPSRRTGSE